MTKKQRRKLERLVRKLKTASNRCITQIEKSKNGYAVEYYSGMEMGFSSSAYYLEQFLEGK